MIHARYALVRDRIHIIFGPPSRNSLGIIRSLGREGIRPVVVTLPRPKFLPFVASRYVKEIHIENDLDKCVDYIIEKYGLGGKKCFLHLTNDPIMQECDKRYDELKDLFYLFHGEGQGALSRYFGKKVQCDLAKACGLPTPGYEVVARGEMPQTLHYPIYVKCMDSFGAWKEDMEICRTPEELREAYNHLVSDQWLMQDFIDKQTEVSLQGISVRGGEQVYMPYKKAYTRLRDKDYGTYMYYDANDLPDSLIDGIRRVIRAIHFSGCFEIEFLQDKQGNLFFLEINLRYSGSNQGMDCGGVNLPLEWALSELTGSIDESAISLRGERFYVMNDFLDIPLMLHGKVSFFKWLHDFWRADCYYVLDWRDLKPPLVYGYNCVCRKLGRFFKPGA